jgi:catechol 2,3-dioxygenase-like lactoylglutathione lyase family enzyme
MRISRLAWLGIRTEAADELVGFFRDTLGLEIVQTDDHGSVFVLPGGGKVEVERPDVEEWQHFTTGPVPGFLVDDVIAATESLKRAGVHILSGPHVLEDGAAWVHFRAPDGNVYELTQGADLEPQG